jgi:hypothetical protein
MARGWESKSVESQQFEAPDRGRDERVSAEELERRRKRESLELSRRRVMNELQSARSEVHRTALSNALAHLDAELSRLQ